MPESEKEGFIANESIIYWDKYRLLDSRMKVDPKVSKAVVAFGRMQTALGDAERRLRDGNGPEEVPYKPELLNDPMFKGDQQTIREAGLDVIDVQEVARKEISK